MQINLDPGYDLESERQLAFWMPCLQDTDSLPVLQRAYRAVVALLVVSGLRGLAGVKTAKIAELAGTTESTLFRHVQSRDHLVAQSVDWCWSVLNERITRRSFEHPLANRTPHDMILSDVRAVLGMYDDDLGRLCGTGAFLSFRRSEALVKDFGQESQQRYFRRLEVLCAELLADCETHSSDPSIVATFLTNSLATAWFTWLFDSSSRESQGLLGTEFVVHGIERHLEDVSLCRFEPVDNRI